MPRYPNAILDMGVDPLTPAGRFNPRPAVAISTGEYGDGEVETWQLVAPR